MREREIYLMRLYLRPGGWRLTIVETMDFETGANWSLLAFGWNRKDGIELTLNA